MNSQTQILPNLLQILCFDLQVIFYVLLLLQIRDLRIVWCIEGALYGVTVKYVKFSEDDHTRSGLLGSLVGKLAVREGKHLVPLSKHVRYESDHVVVFVLVDVILWAGAPVHKHILLPGVAVKVTVEKDHLVILRAGLR
jgi:hypothetical protein